MRLSPFRPPALPYPPAPTPKPALANAAAWWHGEVMQLRRPTHPLASRYLNLAEIPAPMARGLKFLVDTLRRDSLPGKKGGQASIY
jgi:hypothetical protein